MFRGIEKKNLMLIYAVIGFGSVALVALGELSVVKTSSVLFSFYLKLVFGGFLVFYAVFFYFTLLGFSKKIDKKDAPLLKFVFGEKSSRVTIFAIIMGVLFYWILAFAELMGATSFKFF